MVTTAIAIAGFLLALISVSWQIWTYHKSRREQISGTLLVTAVRIAPGKNAPALRLDICNYGQVPVYIKAVALTWGDESPKLGSTLTELEFKEYPPKKPPLQPGDGTKYFLASIVPGLLAKPSEQPPEKVWVSVKSQKKEVLRVQGEEVEAYLAEIVKVEKSRSSNGAKSKPG